MKPIVKVVGALIKNNQNEILICQRPINKTRSLLWEFVGGKVEKNESLKESLIRECKEELDILVKPLELFLECKYSYSDITVNLFIFQTEIIKGTPTLIEHNDLKWVKISDLDKYKFCPADKPVIRKIKNQVSV